MADLLLQQTEATTKAVNDLAAAFKNLKTGVPALNKTAKSSLDELRTLTAGFDSMKKDIREALLSIDQSVGALPQQIATALADSKVVVRAASKKIGEELTNGVADGVTASTGKARSAVRAQIAMLQAEYEQGVKAGSKFQTQDLLGLKTQGISLFPKHREQIKELQDQWAGFTENLKKNEQAAKELRASQELFAADYISDVKRQIAADKEHVTALLEHKKLTRAEQEKTAAAYVADVRRQMAVDDEHEKALVENKKRVRAEQEKTAAAYVADIKRQIAADDEHTKALLEHKKFVRVEQEKTAAAYAEDIRRQMALDEEHETALLENQRRVRAQQEKFAAEYMADVRRQMAIDDLHAKALVENAKITAARTPAAPIAAALPQITGPSGMAAPVTALNAALAQTPTKANAASLSLKNLGIDANDAHSAVRGLASGFGLMFLTWGKLLPLLAGAALSNSFVQTIKLGTEVANTMEAMSALGGATARDMGELNRVLLETGRSGPIGLRETSEAMKTLSLAGLKTVEVISALPQVLNFAIAGDTSITQAAETLTSVATAYGYTAEQYSLVSDIIAKTAAESKASIESLSEAFKTSTVLAEQYGVSLKDTSIGLAALANTGVSGTAAGTALRNFYNDLTGRSKESRQLLKDLGLEGANLRDKLTGNFKDILDIVVQVERSLEKAVSNSIEKSDTLGKLVTERGGKVPAAVKAMIEAEMKALNLTMDDAVISIRKRFEDNAGFAAIAAAKMAATSANQIKSVLATLESAAFETFAKLEPMIIGTSAKLKNAFNSEEFKTGLTNLAVGVGAVTSAFLTNLDVLASLGAAYLAFKAGTVLAGVFSYLTAQAAAASAGLVAMGVGTRAAAVGMGTLAGASVASTGVFGAFAAKAATFAAFLAGPWGIAIAAATAALALWVWWSNKSNDALSGFSTAKSDAYVDSLKQQTQALKDRNEAAVRGMTLDQVKSEREGRAAGAAAELSFQQQLLKIDQQKADLQKSIEDRQKSKVYVAGDPKAEARELLNLENQRIGLLRNRERVQTQVANAENELRKEARINNEREMKIRKELEDAAAAAANKRFGGALTGAETPKEKAKREAAEKKEAQDKERAEEQRRNREWNQDQQMRADNSMQILEKEHATRLAKLKALGDNEVKLIDAREKAGLQSVLEAGFERIAAVERTEAAVLREMEEGIAAQQANYNKIRETAKARLFSGLDSPAEFERNVENAKNSLDSFVEANRNAAIAIKDNAFTRLTLAAISAQGEIKKLDEGFRKYWENLAREEQAENERAQNEISNLGLSERQLTIKNAAYSAQAKALGELRKAQDEYNNANKELEAFYARLNASAATGPYTQEQQDLIDAAATKVERLGTQVERLGDLYAGAGAKAGKTAAELYDATQNQIFVNGIAEAVTTGLFEGGKSGSKKLRDVITAELRKPITIFVNAIVNSLMQGSGLGGAGGLIQSVAASFVAGNSSNGGGPTGELAKTAVGIGYNSVTGQGYSKALVVAIEKIGSTLTTTTIPALQEFGVTLLGNSINIAEWVAANGSAIMGYINAFMALLNKEYGKAIGTAIGTYIGSLWGPIGAAIGSVVGSLIGGWIDKYFGGGGGPKTESHFGPGVSTHGGPDFAKQISDTIEVSYAAFATSLGLAVKELEVGVHTSIDTLGDAMTILEVTAFSEGKKIYDRIDRVKNRENVGRNPEDLNKAIQEEMSFVLLAALKNSDLPGQFKEYLQKATNLEEAAKILEPLIKLREQFNTLSVVFEQLNSATLNSQVSLVEMNGTFDDLTSKLSKYFENYYSEAEKFSSISDTVSRALSQVGLTMPDIAQGSESARAAFRSMVEAQDLNTESGRATYTVLLSVADSFAQLTPKAEAATSAVVETVAAINQQAEAMKSQALALEEQIFQLENAGNTAALRERELATIPEANKALQQRIYALQDESAAAQLAADKTKALADETTRLETELFNASATAAQIRDRELSGLNEANRVTQLRIYALQDEKTANELATAAIEKAAAAAEATMQQRLGLENELLQLQGNTTELRRRELNAITDLNNKGIQQSIWALQDMQAAAESSSRAMEEAAQKQAAITAQRLQLENQILQMEGNTTELRARELAGIDDGHNKSLQQYIWAMEDQKVANEQAAQAAQQTAQANQQAAQAASESASAISNAAQEMANAARQAADAMASEFDGLYRQALTLSGNTAALRAMDLEKLHPANRALQEQIWALEDQKAALDKATESQQSYSNSVSDTADFLKGISKNVKEYFDGLRVNDGGLGSPALQAQHARAQYEEQLTLAKGGNRDALSSITTYADNLIKTRTAISRDGSDVKTLIAQLEKQLTELPTMVSAEEMIVNAINNSTTTTTQTATALNLDAINAAIAAAREQVDAANAAAGAVVQAQQTGSTAQVQAANTTTAALNTTNMTLAQFQQKLVVEMTATAQSAISKLITYATNTDNLPADLKYLALAESLPLLQRTVNLIQDSNMNPETKFLALKTADTLTRTVDAIFSSTLSEEVRMLALKTNDSITRVVGATLNPNVTEEVRTLALKASDGFTRTVTAVLSASTTDETRILALKTHDGFIRTISAVLSADMAQETKQLALKTSDGFTRTVSAVLASGVTDETKQLALKASDGFTRIVSAVQAAGISDETRQLALKGSDAITRTITAVLGSSTTELVKQLALKSSDEITRVVTVVLGAGTSEDTRQLALKTSDGFTRTIDAVLASTISSETKTLALKSNDGFIRTVSAVLASGVSEEAKQVMLKGSDNFTRTVTAIISSGQSDEAKQLALKSNDSFVRTFNAVLGSADSTALSLLNALSSSITKTVQTVMGSSDPQAIQLAQLGTSYITKYINSAMGSNDPEALALALKNSEAITKTINAIVQTGSITSDQLNLIRLLNGDVYDHHVIQAAVALEASSGFNSALSSSIATALNQSLAAMFTTLDTSVNGLLDKAELQAALGPLATNSMLDSVYKTLDADGDGQISRLEAIKGSAAWTADTNNWIGTTNATSIDRLASLMNLNANQIDWLRQNYLTGQWIATEANAIKGTNDSIAGSSNSNSLKSDDIRYYTSAIASSTGSATLSNVFGNQINNGDLRNLAASLDSRLREMSLLIYQIQQGSPLQVYSSNRSFGNGMQVFAAGGAFTNSVVRKPTSFNMGQMGEAGPEGILPLANVGGVLGVHAGGMSGRDDGYDFELLQELRALRAEVADLRRETRSVASNTSKSAKTLERLDRDGVAERVE